MGSCWPDFSACQASGSECGRGPRNAHSRAYLPSSGLSSSVLSHDECSAKGMGNGCMERVREQKMLEIKESAGGSREVFPTTWQTDAGKWAASSIDSNLAASCACTWHTSSAKDRELWLCISSPSTFSIVWGMPAPCQCKLEPVHSGLWAELWARVPWLLQVALRCSHSITWAAAQLLPAFSDQFFLSQSISLWCLRRKVFQGLTSLWFKQDICPKWDGFQKILIKKKKQPNQNPCNVSYFVHFVISPICLSVSWGCTGIDIVVQKLMIPPLC